MLLFAALCLVGLFWCLYSLLTFPSRDRAQVLAARRAAEDRELMIVASMPEELRAKYWSEVRTRKVTNATGVKRRFWALVIIVGLIVVGKVYLGG